MQLSHTLRVITPTLDGDLLSVLARADRSFTGRELARTVGASQEGARTTLARLVEQGIVTRQRAGSAHLYQLNQNHLSAPSIIALADLRAEFLRRLRAAMTHWRPAPTYAALFGSAARGQERADSDLDLLVMRPPGVATDHPAWAAQKTALAAQARGWTGNDVRFLDIGLDDLADTDSSPREDVLADVQRDGIPLAGREAALRSALRTIRQRA